MNFSSNKSQQLSIGQRIAALVASATITLSVFAGVVSLADDQPMAIAGQSSVRTLAQGPKQRPAAVAVAQAEMGLASAPNAH